MGISEKMAAKSIRLASSCSTSSSAAQRKAGGAGCVWARKSKTQMMCRRTRVRGVRRVRCSATSSTELCRDKVSPPKVREAVEGERVHKITFVGDNNEQTVVDCPEHMYILEAAEQAGVDLPATCRGGICGACVGKVKAGDIDMSDIDDLSFVIDEGLAILCMARASSDMTIEAQCDWGNISMTEWQGGTFKTGSPTPLADA